MFNQILNMCKGKKVRIVQDAPPGGRSRRYDGVLLPGPRGLAGDNPEPFELFDWLVRDRNVLMGFENSDVKEVSFTKYSDTGKMVVGITLKQTTLK